MIMAWDTAHITVCLVAAAASAVAIVAIVVALARAIVLTLFFGRTLPGALDIDFAFDTP